MKRLIAVPLIVAGCAQPLTEYRPVVDPAFSPAAAYEADLSACIKIAQTVEAEYNQRAVNEMIVKVLLGAAVGAAAGAIVGDDYIGAGAAYGAGAGALAPGSYDYDMTHYGPRRVVDRCMEERGHRVLADLGRS